jgi:hypothetical protein
MQCALFEGVCHVLVAWVHVTPWPCACPAPSPLLVLPYLHACFSCNPPTKAFVHNRYTLTLTKLPPNLASLGVTAGGHCHNVTTHLGAEGDQ